MSMVGARGAIKMGVSVALDRKLAALIERIV